MSKNLTIEECQKLGVNFPCNCMDNGEFRFRCMDNGSDAGWGYILIKMPDDIRGWQNSHHHQGIVETFIVQKGWIGAAELIGDDMVIRVYRPGDIFTTKPNCAHNIYMSAGAVIHTVKHGDCSLKNDWLASPELDSIAKGLTESDIFRLAVS